MISNASCTTNCLAPLVKSCTGNRHEHGLMTTIHSYTNDQVLTDVYQKDLRRARAATQSMIPTKTGAAAAVGLVLPELSGRLDGFAIRVPTINVSLVDLTFVASRKTSKEEIHDAMRKAAEGPLKGILGYNDLPLVSMDFNHDARSSIYEATSPRSCRVIWSSPRLVRQRVGLFQPYVGCHGGFDGSKLTGTTNLRRI